jgi:phage gp29-like protein
MTTINKNELQNSQLDTNFQLQNLQREYQSHLRDTNLTPLRIRQIFERAEQGQILEQCDFFADMEERDGHICAELAKRKRGVLGLKWSLQPPHNATAQEITQAQNVQDLLLGLDDFEDVLLNLTEAIGYGFSCLELQWQLSNNVWMPEKLLHRPARWFQLSMFNRDDVRLRDGSSDGAELWQAGWLVHKHKAKSGDASRSGLLRSLAFPYLFKHYALTDFNEFLEIFGLPMMSVNIKQERVKKIKPLCAVRLNLLVTVQKASCPIQCLLNFNRRQIPQATRSKR